MSIDPASIQMLVEGDGERTFLLLNGAGQSLQTWDYVVPGLLQLGRVVRFDAPGVGRSPPPDEPYSFEELGRAVLQLVEPQRVGSLIVVGHAWGARAAQVMARDHALEQEIAGVVIGSGGGKFAPLARRSDMRTATVGAEGDEIESWNRRFEAAYCAPGFRARDPERARWLLELARTTPCAWSVVSGAMELSPVETYWGRFDCPALLLYGADDLVGHSANAEDLHRALPDSTLVYIEEAGHFVICEQGERFAAEIRGWLERRGC